MKRRTLTLIELLVKAAILALLIALLSPSPEAARKPASGVDLALGELYIMPPNPYLPNAAAGPGEGLQERCPRYLGDSLSITIARHTSGG